MMDIWGVFFLQFLLLKTTLLRHDCESLYVHMYKSSPWICLEKELLGCREYDGQLIRHCQTVFKERCINLLSHQPWMKNCLVHFLQHLVFSSLCCLFCISMITNEVWVFYGLQPNEMPFHVFCPLFFFITIIFILNLILVYLKIYWLKSTKPGSWLTSDDYLPHFLEQVIYSLWISLFIWKLEKIILILHISPACGENRIRLGTSRAL